MIQEAERRSDLQRVPCTSICRSAIAVDSLLEERVEQRIYGGEDGGRGWHH
jgi:hypothetical protein